ncbi:MAG: asparaginase [Actinobacteria bacterium]|nr:asparaginase [Actinomycetota bacterium]
MITLRTGAPTVDVERAGVIECVHTGHVVLLAGDGEIRQAIGDVQQPIYPRSANKPLQAVGLLRAGFAGPSEWIALSAASHAARPEHVALVTTMLNSGGFDESWLQCPPERPMDDGAMLAGGGQERRLFMNCSGKHAAMLLTVRANGWDPTSYLEVDHPLQLRMRAIVEELVAAPVAATGVDGCGAPLFAVPLVALARGFARLATAPAGSELHAVAEAMRTHPELVAGPGQGATMLMNAVPGLVAKDGAEGVFAGALPDGSAFALKVDDGARRAATPLAAACMMALGAAGEQLESLLTSPVLGGGRPVGAVSVRPGLFDRT